jgi:aerobic C4-dicarboxylate transport protein
VVNLLGNCVATFVVSKWEGQFDRSVMLRAFRGEITNHDSAIMLGVQDDFENQELERISGGQEPSPKFRGGPNPGEIPEFQMSRSAGAQAGPPPENHSAALLRD